jgi:uncharacterized protein involved in outer membrane biogenesis
MAEEKKKISPLRIIGVIIIVIAVVLIIGGFLADSILKTGVEKVGSKVLGVDVSLGKASLKIFAGEVQMKDLDIANPQGYKQPTFMELGEIYVDTDMGSLMSDKVIIDKLLMDDLTVTIEQSGLTNNMNEILKNLPQAEKEEKPEEPKPKAKGKQLEIADLELKNITVRYQSPVGEPIQFKLNPITMKNLGSDEKLDMAKLTGKIMVAVAGGIATQGAAQLPKELVGSVSSTLKNTGLDAVGIGTEMLKKSTQKGKDIGGEILKGAEDVGKGAGDTIKGLFGGDKEK